MQSPWQSSASEYLGNVALLPDPGLDQAAARLAQMRMFSVIGAGLLACPQASARRLAVSSTRTREVFLVTGSSSLILIVGASWYAASRWCRRRSRNRPWTRPCLHGQRISSRRDRICPISLRSAPLGLTKAVVSFLDFAMAIAATSLSNVAQCLAYRSICPHYG